MTAANDIEPQPQSPETALPPLAAARQALQTAEDHYRALGDLDAGLKQRERHLDNALLEVRHALTLTRAVADAERCRVEEDRLQSARGVVRGERLGVYEQSQAASHRLIEATAHYRAIEDQARGQLRLLRARQAEAQHTPQPWHQVELLREADQAQEQLAALVGAEEAAALASDPQARPAWMRGA